MTDDTKIFHFIGELCSLGLELEIWYEGPAAGIQGPIDVGVVAKTTKAWNPINAYTPE